MEKLLKNFAVFFVCAVLLVTNLLTPVAFAATEAYARASDNLFVFEQWANNEKSAAVGPTATDGTLTKDITAGSLTLTNNTTLGEVYTRHSMDSNEGYYSMSVESGTRYAFGYITKGTATSCEGFVFYFDEQGTFISFQNHSATPNGTVMWEFTTPANAAYIQIRFDNNTPGSYTTFSDIKICRVGIYELAFENLFIFEKWADHPLSGIINQGFTGAELTKDISAGCFTLTNNSTTGEIYTSHSMGSTLGYYYMPVKPNTTYIYEYNVNDDITSFETFFFYFNSYDAFISFDCTTASRQGRNVWSFTTPENASFIQVRFDNNIIGTSVTVSDIRICESEAYEYSKDIASRKSYTYAGSDDVYGELPKPQREGLAFAGWYTGPDGTGDRITADTVIRASSYSLYAKWEPMLSEDIIIVSLPDKREYCVGEKLNTKGLEIFVTHMDGTTAFLESGFYCSPEVMSKAGEQIITISYGDKSAEFTVTVKESDEVSVSFNGSAITVPMTNYKYAIGKTATPFNRYEIGYSSDSYVRATMLMGSTVEEFFLEPADNGSFSGYIDGFLEGTTQSQITSIAFTALDKDYMDFTLESVTLSKATSLGDSNGMVYLSDNNYKIGIDLDWGGALSYLEDLTNDVMASVARDSILGSTVTEVDFSSKVNDNWRYNTSSSVNLINCNDTGRLVQQSYYGTNLPPYELGDYNGTPWNYNPVQGGNVKNEPSKIVDLKVSANEIYVKCRPLDWGKYSDKFAAANGIEAKYGADYMTPTYMEAWYTLEDGLMRATCRFVDFSGYPQATTTQELPAFYCVEPLNNFVYYSGGEPWSDSNTKVTESNLAFWGEVTDQFFTCNENWAAYVGDDADSFGIGLYCPGQTNMLTGVFNKEGSRTASPATESPTSYIAAVDTFTFKSFNPFSYAYYITTGNVDTIRDNFKAVATNPSDPCNVGYTNGFCNVCGKYEVPTLINDKYDLNGDGVKENVYEISNAGELHWFRDYVNSGNVNANAVLICDITDNSGVLTSYGTVASDTSLFRKWTPIGTATYKYNGHFDGQCYTINGLYMNDTNISFGGLFGYTASSSVIEKVGVDYSYLKGNQYIGGICGYNSGKIDNCYCLYTMLQGNSYVGGITGYNDSTVQNCYNAGLINASSYVGGVAGANNSKFSNCYYLVNVATDGSSVVQNGIGQSAQGTATADVLGSTEGKTIEEFANGEVAYLLQAANTKQLWGQKSNISGAVPVFDKEGVYKVNAVENEDNYVLADIGDIIKDDEVDVYDYQQLVNQVISDEVLDFKGMVSSDIDGDGYLDVIDCALMQLIISGHHNKVNVYLKGDFDFDGIPFTKEDIQAIKKALINQDKLNTKQKYACDLNFDGILDSVDKELLAQQSDKALMHVFSDMQEVVKLRNTKANVIILAGQSNAYGISPLTNEVKATIGDTDFSNIKIKYTNINSDDGVNNWRVHFSNSEFETFRLGIGGQADRWFGPELGVAYYLATNEATKDETWYIIKTTASGTFLGGQWLYDTTGKYFNATNAGDIKKDLGVYLADGMMDLVSADLKVIANKHGANNVNIRSFMWMQGESDASIKETAEQYGELENILINRVRTELGGYDKVGGIPFVDGAIAAYKSGVNIWPYADIVNSAKASNAAYWYIPENTTGNVINKTTAGLYSNDGSSATKLTESIWIDTSTCISKLENNNENNENDGYHYCGEAMLKLGIWFAQGMLVF